MAKTKLKARPNQDELSALRTENSLEHRIDNDGEGLHVDADSGKRLVLEDGTHPFRWRSALAARLWPKQQLSEAVVVLAETRHRLRRQLALPDIHRVAGGFLFP